MKTPVLELGENLLHLSPPGAMTDYEAEHRFELVAPNTLNAWTHCVPELSGLSDCPGVKNTEGFFKALHLVVLGLYGDSLLICGADSRQCLYVMIESLLCFKKVYPGWRDAYSEGHNLLVKNSDNIFPVLESIQSSVEKELVQSGVHNRLPTEVNIEFRELLEDCLSFGTEREGCYIKMVEASLLIAREFVDLRDLLNKEAGTFKSFIRNLFRKIDCQYFVDKANYVKARLDELQNEVDYAQKPVSFNEMEIANALQLFINAQIRAADILVNKAEFMVIKARGEKMPQDGLHDFLILAGDESSSLQECQKAGDHLTRLYVESI